MGLAVQLVEKLKQTMKQRNITYADMAKRIKVSEATLKRSFSKRLFTIERIEQICLELQLTLEDLAKSNNPSFKVDMLTPDQEEELAADDQAFVVFYLTSIGLTYDLILKKYSISQRDLNRTLLRLDKLNLIKLLPNNGIIPCVKQAVWWSKDGPLSKIYGNHLRADFFNSDFDGAHEQLCFTAGNLTPESIKIIRKRQTQVINAFNELLELDAQLPLKQKINVTFVSGLRPWTLPALTKNRKNKP